MIHFKKLKRLLLVAGLLSAQALAADPCKFKLKQGANYGVDKDGSGTCTSSN